MVGSAMRREDSHERARVEVSRRAARSAGDPFCEDLAEQGPQEVDPVQFGAAGDPADEPNQTRWTKKSPREKSSCGPILTRNLNNGM